MYVIFVPVSYRTSALLITPSRASGTTDHVRSMDVGDATSTTSMDVVKVGLENQVGLE